MRRVLALCLTCCACGTAAPRHIALLTRADDTTAQLEERLLGPYRASHPGLHVEQQPVTGSRADYRRILAAALALEPPPDAFFVEDGDVPVIAGPGAGGTLDLAPYLSRVSVDLTRYDPTVLGIFRRGNAVYALPRGYTPLLIVYNRDLFDRSGIGYPGDDWTWDDFLRTARRLTRDDAWGAAFDRRPAFWLPWIWSGGGDVLCSDGRRASGCLDSPATISALRWYAGWVTREGVAPRAYDPRDEDGDNARSFLAGRVAMMTVSHAAVRDLRAAATAGRLRLGFAPIPHRAAVAPVTVLYANAYAVPGRILGRKGAVELVADLTDSLPGAARGNAGMELPAVTSAARALAAADTLGWEAAFLRAAAHGRPAWRERVTQWRDVEGVLSTLMDRITLEGAEPGRAARATARELDRLLGATR
ncbi:MAG TPA: extracellular solute-binding protein [Gemmatimonadales bacterium]|nr:extracellular solute-binding protein [Gemmatimonadales bacterium]